MTWRTLLSVKIWDLSWTADTLVQVNIIDLFVWTKNAIHFLTIEILREKARNAFFASPELFLRRAYTQHFRLIIKSVLRTFLALEFLLIIKVVFRAFGTFLAIKERERFWTVNTLLLFYIIYLFMWAKFASFISGIKKLWMKALYALTSSKVFFLRRTLALFPFCVIYLFEGTLLASLNWYVKERCLRARSALLLFHNGCTHWAPLTFIVIYVVNVIFWARLAFFLGKIEVIREIAGNASFISGKW